MPINQLFYFDCMELAGSLTEEQLESGKDRYDGLRVILGDELLNKVFNCKLFMIGAGAIGCELLKNYAMLGLGTGAEG